MRRAGDLLEGTSGDNKGGRCGGLQDSQSKVYPWEDSHTGRSPHSVLRSWLGSVSRPGFSVRDCVDSKVHSSLFLELAIPTEGTI